MPKRIYKIVEIIGMLIIAFVTFKVFPYIKEIFSFIFKIIIPFVVAFSIAFIFEPLIKKLEEKKINRKFTIIVISGVFIVIIFLVFKFLIPYIGKQLGILFKMLPDYIDNISNFIDYINDNFFKTFHNFEIDMTKVESFLTEKITGFISSTPFFLQKSFSYLLTILVTPILTIYFLNDFDKIENRIKIFLEKRNKNRIYNLLSKIKESIRQYVKGVIIIMIIFSIVSGFVFLFIGLDYAFLFGIVIGITDIIPYLGPYIGGAVVVFFAFVSNSANVFVVLLSIVILQFLESNFFVPKIQSKTMQTNPILVILSVTFFGELFGIFGMLIAVPLEKIVEIIIFSYLDYKKM